MDIVFITITCGFFLLTWGLGEPRVNVLQLNLALDALASDGS